MRQGAAKTSSALRSSVRDGVSRGFTLVEDVVYVGLGLLLSGAAVVLLVSLVTSSTSGAAWSEGRFREEWWSYSTRSSSSS